MNFEGVKKLEGQYVGLWPRPLVMPAGWRARMQWRVGSVDRRRGVVELHAPSGHFFNAADVIHHFQHEGQWLILDAQVMISGNEIELQPRPWGATQQVLRMSPRVRRVSAGRSRRPEPNWGGLLLMGLGFVLGRAAAR